MEYLEEFFRTLFRLANIFCQWLWYSRKTFLPDEQKNFMIYFSLINWDCLNRKLKKWKKLFTDNRSIVTRKVLSIKNSKIPVLPYSTFTMHVTCTFLESTNIALTQLFTSELWCINFVSSGTSSLNRLIEYPQNILSITRSKDYPGPWPCLLTEINPRYDNKIFKNKIRTPHSKQKSRIILKQTQRYDLNNSGSPRYYYYSTRQKK